ncbi:GntR family transcriptional regulator [Hephaestia caeni]|uniref:GntR family transcriptional regulator n=1 Tax=Hephaestia caeni TaxID=645617 RepID=A0A397PBI3_9SPHN|nr:FadR/GntR family transcriptional regulator [Hephaestia caeni]RIA46936.1 GntR family transcriptional regulator [Hephaestia caeni]
MSPPPKSGRLYQFAAEKIALSIAIGQYEVGSRLPAERDLAADFGVSRPTIREAIIALEIDGLVEVRVGSGVYVVSQSPRSAKVAMDIGAFELTESRLLIEGEVAALAAVNVTDADIEELEALLDEMEASNTAGAEAGERVDQRFHAALARCTRNSAMAAVVDLLWTIRSRSPQCVRTFEKSRDKGRVPVVSEHRAIVDALKQHEPAKARAAMRAHLNRVLDYLLDATETETIQQVKDRMAEQRSRYAGTDSL